MTTNETQASEELKRAKECADFLIGELRLERADIKDGVGPEAEQAHAFLRDYLDKNNPMKAALPLWRPIEECPRDGTHVLLWWPRQYHAPIVGYWRDKHELYVGWHVSGWAHNKLDTEPTHFMLLPPAPKSGERE